MSAQAQMLAPAWSNLDSSMTTKSLQKMKQEDGTQRMGQQGEVMLVVGRVVSLVDQHLDPLFQVLVVHLGYDLTMQIPSSKNRILVSSHHSLALVVPGDLLLDVRFVVSIEVEDRDFPVALWFRVDSADPRGAYKSLCRLYDLERNFSHRHSLRARDSRVEPNLRIDHDSSV
jgi:hypothetical protein